MNRTRTMAVRSSIGATVMLALLAGGRVQAADRSSEASAPALQAPRAATSRAWRPRAWAPAATGLAPRSAIAAAPPVRIERRPNGMLIAHMDERYAEYTMVTVGADGAPTVTCVHGSEAAASFMKQALVPVATPSSARVGK